MLNTVGGCDYQPPSQTPTLNSKGHYRGELNFKEQTKKISKLKYIDLPKSKNELFLAEVTFELVATGKPLSFRSSVEKGTLREAREEAARVACRYLGKSVESDSVYEL